MKKTIKLEEIVNIIKKNPETIKFDNAYCLKTNYWVRSILSSGDWDIIIELPKKNDQHYYIAIDYKDNNWLLYKKGGD